MPKGSHAFDSGQAGIPLVPLVVHGAMLIEPTELESKERSPLFRDQVFQDRQE